MVLWNDVRQEEECENDVMKREVVLPDVVWCAVHVQQVFDCKVVAILSDKWYVFGPPAPLTLPRPD